MWPRSASQRTSNGSQGRDHDLQRRDRNRQDSIALRIRVRDDLGYRRDIDLHRIDFQVRQAGLVGQPLGQDFEAQWLAVEKVDRLDVRDQCKRMQVEFHARRSRVGARPRGVHVADHAVGQQRRHDRFDVELAVQAQRQRRGGAGRPGEFDSGQRRKLWNGGHVEAPWIR
jgi:hypothetical protein